MLVCSQESEHAQETNMTTLEKIQRVLARELGVQVGPNHLQGRETDGVDLSCDFSVGGDEWHVAIKAEVGSRLLSVLSFTWCVEGRPLGGPFLRPARSAFIGTNRR